MPSWLGIDIGSENVKAALVRSTYRKTVLARLATASVGESGSVAAAIRTATAQVLEGEAQGIDGSATAVDGARTAIHRLQLPATAQKELASVLAFELEAQVPFDLDTAVFDWQVLGSDSKADVGQLSILAAVARVDDVRSRIDVVREAIAQEPERVAVGSLALGALLPYLPLPADGAMAIIDLGAKASDVLIVEGGEAVFARALSCGTEGLPATAARLAREIRVSFAAHRAQGGAAPTSVWICGGGAFVSGAEGFLAGELEIPVHRLPDPSLDMAGEAGGPGEIARYAKAIALAVGLSGKGSVLNLRRGSLAFERGFAWVRERVPLLAGLAAVIVVSFVFSAWAQMHEVHAARAVLESALGAVTKEVLGTEATTAQDAQDLLAKQAVSDEDPMPHADAFDVMVQLSQAVPSSMKHDVEELDVQKEHVTIRGIVGSIPEAQSIASALSDVRCMNDVKIKSTTQSVGGDRQKYLMEFDVKCPEDVKAAPKKKGRSTGSTSGGK